MSEPDIEILDAEPSTELVPVESAPATLFRTSDPDVALERMSQVARSLVDVVEDRNLYVKISGRKHLLVSAWTTLGAMLGVFPVVTWTKENEAGDGYVARVEARTREGQVVGAAEAECSRAESKWKNRDPYALRSMAQTRAISRALRGPLEQVVVLAEYDPTAAEEMPEQSEPAQPSRVTPADATKEQLAELAALIRSLTECEPGVDWKARAREIAGVAGDMLTKTSAEILIGKLREELARATA